MTCQHRSFAAARYMTTQDYITVNTEIITEVLQQFTDASSHPSNG